MLTLRSPRLTETSLPLGTSWLLAACMEAKGKQDLWIRQKPEVLAVLRERAMIQSVESSNRIEGVTIPANRLRPVVLGKVRPRDRSEEELAGYRRALDWILSRKGSVTMTAGVRDTDSWLGLKAYPSESSRRSLIASRRREQRLL